jgi:hypothetical protein
VNKKTVTFIIPFWMIFNKESSLRALTGYIESAGPFDEIYTTLFSHGVNSVGLAQCRAMAGGSAKSAEAIGIHRRG